MASDALKQERLKMNESAINASQLAMDEGTGTDLIQCGKYNFDCLCSKLKPNEYI